MEKLTNRQAQILRFIKEFAAKAGFPPTRLEICKRMGYRSPNAAEEHLRALERKGALQILRHTARGLRPLDTKPVGIPVVGEVVAGSPVLADECIRGYHNIAPGIFSPAADYLLTVRGDSMVDAGIYEGDLLVVHKTDRARDGDIIVARVDNEVTVKRLRCKRGSYKVRLIAENPDYAPIDVDLRSEDFSIEGISVGVIRRFH